jgi:hypothetical protein
MAVDTRSRRASVLGLTLAFNLTLPLADSAVGTEDRAHVAYCYPGIAAAAIGRTAKCGYVVPAETRGYVVPAETRGVKTT